MAEVLFFDTIPDGVVFKYVVVAARYKEKWVFVRHRKRKTLEIPGGHIEEGEQYIQAARRELFEETGAVDFTLELVSAYTVASDEMISGGYLLYADIKELSSLPDSEIAEIYLLDALPESLTYPHIQPFLHKRVLEWMTSQRMKFKTIDENEIHAQNKASWDSIADDFFGVTALPVYGCLCPDEDELCLFPALSGKKVLDIGCGSGHSLKWCGDRGAAELWGLDISEKQLENASRYLNENGYSAQLFNSPMEKNPSDSLNPGLPTGYFDVVYSIYAIGWTTDLQTTFNLIYSYLKNDGVFIFSWDHPFMHCVDEEDGKLIFSGSYHEAEPFTFQKHGHPMTLFNRRLSDYINSLAAAGFYVERIVEETSQAALEREKEYSHTYYTPAKAKQFPLSIIIKARKV